jgi:uncharacterized membrane protein
MTEMERVPGAAEAGESKPSERARWLAAVGYISFLSLLSLWRARRDPFVRYHASQGVLLLLAEMVFLVLAVLLEATVGKIRIAGLIIVGIFIFITGVAALALSAIGFVKALFGEYWSLPFLGEWRNRVPGLDWK